MPNLQHLFTMLQWLQPETRVFCVYEEVISASTQGSFLYLNTARGEGGSSTEERENSRR